MENTTSKVNEVIKALIKAQIKTSYVPEAQHRIPDHDALGLIMSHYFEYDGLAILKACYSALEDSNWHEENRTIEGLIKKYEGKGA